jgi:hypothetical protein
MKEEYEQNTHTHTCKIKKKLLQISINLANFSENKKRTKFLKVRDTHYFMGFFSIYLEKRLNGS